MSETAGEKSFAPTQKRMKDAEKKGDLLRSRELGSAVAVLAGLAWLHYAGPWVLDSLTEVFRIGLIWDRATIDGFTPEATLMQMGAASLPMVLTLGVLTMVVAIGSQLLLGRGGTTPLGFKMNKMDPLQGAKRMFGANGWIELGKALAKVVLLGTIAVWFMMGVTSGVLGLGRGDLTGQLSTAWDMILDLLLWLSLGLIIIAFIDAPVQIVRRLSRLKMSHQEMRDEHKESEGSPEKKMAIRNRQREIARGGVHRAVAEAQFIITNPTHFSVAMTYDPTRAPAPLLLAKGRGEKALAMRELAKEQGVPVLEFPLLARALYFTTRENQMIREELYAAVATVLAFVLSLKRGDKPPRPDIAVPVALRFDEFGRPETN